MIYNTDMDKKTFIENTLFYGIIAAIIYLVYKKLLPILTPFIIGFIIAYVAHEISKKYTGEMEKNIKILVLIFLYVIFVLVMVLLSVYLLDKLAVFVQYIIEVSGQIEPILNDLYKQIINLNVSLPNEVMQVINSAADSVFGILQSVLVTVSGWLVSLVTSIVSSVPNVIISTVVAIVSSFYILLDYDKFVSNASKWLPEKVKNVLRDLVSFIKNKLFKIIKSYVVIMGLTFAELLFGFIVLGIKPAATYAALIALLDILPILGVGTVLIPWGLVDLFTGKIIKGILILILYVVITVVRQFVEPKLVGADLGLDGFTTLVLMMVGLNLGGLVGMIGLPLLLSFIIYMRNIRAKNEQIS